MGLRELAVTRVAAKDTLTIVMAAMSIFCFLFILITSFQFGSDTLVHRIVINISSVVDFRESDEWIIRSTVQGQAVPFSQRPGIQKKERKNQPMSSFSSDMASL